MFDFHLGNTLCSRSLPHVRNRDIKFLLRVLWECFIAAVLFELFTCWNVSEHVWPHHGWSRLGSTITGLRSGLGVPRGVPPRLWPLSLFGITAVRIIALLKVQEYSADGFLWITAVGQCLLLKSSPRDKLSTVLSVPQVLLCLSLLWAFTHLKL